MGSEMANDQALQGVAQLIAKLRDIKSLDDGKALRAGVRAGMRPALLAARSKIPIAKKQYKLAKTYGGGVVQPGYAQKAIRVITTVSPDKQQASALMSVRKAAFYAVNFVEIGTSKMAAQPWLRPAFYSTQDAQKQALADKLKAYLEKVSASSGAGNVSSDP
jgi:HK97 gp10 family phage protein